MWAGVFYRFKYGPGRRERLNEAIYEWYHVCSDVLYYDKIKHFLVGRRACRNQTVPQHRSSELSENELLVNIIPILSNPPALNHSKFIQYCCFVI